MNYKELICNALNENRWDDIIQYANEAKSNELNFLGIRKGVINLFDTRGEDFDKALGKIGIKTFYFGGRNDVTTKQKSGDFTEEIIENHPVVVCAGTTALAKIASLGYPINVFKTTYKSIGVKGTEGQNKYKKFGKYDRIWTITNKMTGEEFKYNNHLDENVLKAYMREKQMKSILDE
jgi:hypothetical protein